MSALEVAAFTQFDDDLCNHYIDIALEYNVLASSGLRTELTHITSENRQAAFALSSILMVLGLALPRFTCRRGEQGKILDHVLTYLALLRGLRMIVDSKEDFRYTEPLLANYPTVRKLLCITPTIRLRQMLIVTNNCSGTHYQSQSSNRSYS